MGSYGRLWSESHGQNWALEGSGGGGAGGLGLVKATHAHPSLPLAPTHIRSRQIFFLSLLLPVATQAAWSLFFHHALRGRGGCTLQREEPGRKKIRVPGPPPVSPHKANVIQEGKSPDNPPLTLLGALSTGGLGAKKREREGKRRVSPPMVPDMAQPSTVYKSLFPAQTLPSPANTTAEWVIPPTYPSDKCPERVSNLPKDTQSVGSKGALQPPHTYVSLMLWAGWSASPPPNHHNPWPMLPCPIRLPLDPSASTPARSSFVAAAS